MKTCWDGRVQKLEYGFLGCKTLLESIEDAEQSQLCFGKIASAAKAALILLGVRRD
jgi:hypothetical protein